MSKIKYNDEQYLEVIKNMLEGSQKISEALDIWEESFDNLYNNFIKNGFINNLYKEAEDQYYNYADSGYVVSPKTTTIKFRFLSISSIVACFGALIGAVIKALFGLSNCVKNPKEIQWIYDARDDFEKLLTSCMYGEQSSFINTVNVRSKLDSVYVSLLDIQKKIDNFNKLYADLSASAETMGFSDKMMLASDGVTVLGVETSVKIGDETVTMSVSDAMNAFYTYTGTVMAAEIEAKYMEDTYGVNVNYMDIVNNANGFVVKTIESGLYSHEFVNSLLPAYTPSTNGAYEKVSQGLGVSTDKFESILSNAPIAAGVAGLGLGLIGASFIGAVTSPVNGGNPSDVFPSQPSGGTGGSSGGGGTTNNEEPVTTKPVKEEIYDDDDEELIEDDTETDELEEVEDIDDVDNTEEEVIGNTVTILEIQELQPEVLQIKDELTLPEVDYDELARIEYEALGEEKITEDRLLAIATANSLFDNPDKSTLRMHLEKFGYSESEIEVIMQNRDYTITAFVEGSQRESLAELANQLAAKDGIADFDTMYDDGQKLSDIVDGSSDKLLTLMSSDPNVKTAQETMLREQSEYKAAIESMNDALADVEESKKALDELKSTIISNSGTDSSKWTEDEAKRYNEAIQRYNEKVQDATNKINEAKVQKDEYTKSVEEYDTAKNAFYTQLIEDSKKQDQEIASDTAPVVTGQVVDGGTATATPQEYYGEGVVATEDDLAGLSVGPNGVTII